MSDESETPLAVEPLIADDTREVEAGIGLCLSGGGYRAMLFHLGALWRCHEAGLLGKIARLSSVSGGSITAGVLAIAWPKLFADPPSARANFIRHVVEPIRGLAGRTIDGWAIGSGLLLPGSINDRVADFYREHLFGAKTLQDLPDEPRFVFNATNIQSGALWRFSKPYMGDWHVGLIRKPPVDLAVAVAASSAFPPVLSPAVLRLDPRSFDPASGTDLRREPYTSEVHLTDGGVYDNLGLETVWKRFRTVLVSDGGGQLVAIPEPEADWVRQSKRILDVIDHQVRSLRKRQLISSFKSGLRAGAYWGIRTDIQAYGLGEALAAPFDRTMALAEIPTRLKHLPPETQERLVNWGYAVCDAALRRHVAPGLARGDLPYAAMEI